MGSQANMNIPLVNLSRQHDEIRQEVFEFFETIMDSNQFILGEELACFEKEFSSFSKVAHTIGVGNGTDALYIALKTLGVGANDIVLTVANTFMATAEAICQVGALPEFVEVDESTMLMSVEHLEQALIRLRKENKPVKAIIPVHLYGHSCDMPEIMTLARRFEVYVIEDCAQAVGAHIAGQGVGSFGDFGTFSFFPGKNLGCLGDGGAVVTNQAHLAERARMFKDHGRKDKYVHEILGINSRLDNLQAGVLRIKLRKLEKWTKHRERAALLYHSTLSGIEIRLPLSKEGFRHVYHLYVIRVKNRDQLKSFLAKQGIHCGIHYPVALHQQPVFAGSPVAKQNLELSEVMSTQILSIPLDSHITDSEIEFVCESISAGMN